MNKKATVAIIIVLGTSVILAYQLYDERYHDFYGFRVINKYNHDPRAFTQGLVFFDGIFYEGTGLYGESDIRLVEIQTGDIIQSRKLPSKYFGEGVTIFGDKVYQITWRENLGFVYDLSLEQLSTFQIRGEGWGLTEDGTFLIMSNGTSTLSFLDHSTLSVERTLHVSYDGHPVSNLNELEYIDGMIYANIWQTDNIVIIDPESGRVVSWINLTGLKEYLDNKIGIDVLNGIAYDEENDRLFVTGKLWPNLFEIKLIPE